MGVSVNFNGVIDPAPATMGEKAVAYYRYSSHSQTEQSIEGQQSAARAYAAAKGYKLIHEYTDRAMTGRNDDRAEFQKMLADAAKHKFTVIIVWKVDRFGRNREEITFNKYHCKKNGVRVEYVAENVPTSAEGVILESVLEGMAEYYSLQLSQNIRRGIMESAKKAQSIGGTRLLGYKTGPDKKLEIDPDTAPTVKQIFTMYAAGSTVAEIIAALNAQGLHTLKGTPFKNNSLHSILKNEKYVGVYKYKDTVRIEGGVPAIIDQETFDKVQEMLKINKRAPAHKWSKAEYLLTDKLFCGCCGANMVGESGTGQHGQKYNYYLCTNHKRKHSCPTKAVRQEWIEGIVIDATVKLLKDDKLLNFIVDKTWEYYLAQDEQKSKVDSIKAELNATTKALANLVKGVEAGMDATLLMPRMDELREQKAALEAALAEEDIVQGLKLTKERLQYFLYQFRNLNFKDRNVQKRLISTFVNSVFVKGDEITITFNYQGDGQTITLHDIDTANPPDEGVTGEFDRCVQCSTILP